MCQVVDEPWEVFESWWGFGSCTDCGREDRVLFEEIGPVMEWKREERATEMFLNDGVPDWTIDEDSDFDEAWYRVVDMIPEEVEDRIRTCPQCLEARRWLSEWCRSWMYGWYRPDIIEHWQEDWETRSHTFGRLVLAAQRRWKRKDGSLMSKDDVALLVDRSLAKLRADTGLSFAA